MISWLKSLFCFHSELRIKNTVWSGGSTHNTFRATCLNCGSKVYIKGEKVQKEYEKIGEFY